jgi:hypothetical protein
VEVFHRFFERIVELCQAARAAGWYPQLDRTSPWYRTKTAVAFPDLLTALRQELWRAHFLAAPVPSGRLQNPAPVPHHTQPRAA